jgi:ATP-dependent Clp protease ATP-binding subunit ClpA
MSEFMDESSILRLLGAPPGQPGHERGGELINAIHSKPFSVVLFDEIEKAHPRILDVFLQILDEGRLTDARGAVAHFSETLIIFTSNIGMFGGDHTQNMGMTVMPSDPYDQIERKITAAVHDHFRFKVQRPELMNRIGQNVVVFDFINHRSVHIIFEAILTRVTETIAEEHGIKVSFSDAALADLRELCTHDAFDGGRGIGNRIETHFINPVSHEIFYYPERSKMSVARVIEAEGRTRLEIE